MNTVIFLEPILIVVVVVSTRSMSWDSLADIYSAMFIHGHQLRKMCSWEIRRKHLGAETEPGHCRFICMSYPFPYYVEFLITVNIKVWISTTFTSSHLERILIVGLILHFPSAIPLFYHLPQCENEQSNDLVLFWVSKHQILWLVQLISYLRDANYDWLSLHRLFTVLPAKNRIQFHSNIDLGTYYTDFLAVK